MADTPEIRVTIDQDALRRQIGGSVQEVINEAAMKLRHAADALDGGAWWRDREAYMEKAIAEAREAGRRSADAEIERLVRLLPKSAVQEEGK